MCEIGNPLWEKEESMDMKLYGEKTDFYTRLANCSIIIKEYFHGNVGIKTLDVIYEETFEFPVVIDFLKHYPASGHFAIREFVQQQIRNYINAKQLHIPKLDMPFSELTIVRKPKRKED